MSKSKKVWLVIATSLVFIGMLMFVIVMSINNWDFAKLNTVKYQSGIYYPQEEFTNIYVNTNTANITIEPSENDQCYINVYEQTNLEHIVEVKEDMLVISVVDKRKWYEHFGISLDTPKITIYLPEKYLISDVKIETSTGDIRIKDMLVDSLDLSVSTGDIKITNTGSKKLVTDGNTGDVFLKDVIVEGKLSIERDTGDIEFTRCDAEEIYIETDTGDIEGTLLTGKMFLVETDTGDVDVPKPESGGICKIESDTGDIEISIVK